MKENIMRQITDKQKFIEEYDHIIPKNVQKKLRDEINKEFKDWQVGLTVWKIYLAIIWYLLNGSKIKSDKREAQPLDGWPTTTTRLTYFQSIWYAARNDFMN